jgi:hypothetical protein
MAVDATNVAAGSPLVTGGILAAPIGTALPTNAYAALNAAFVGLGHAGEDGLVPSGDAASTTDIKAWGGAIVASLTDTPATKKYTFVLIEAFNQDVNEFVYGAGNVTVTAASGEVGTLIAIEDKSTEPGPYSLAFELRYGAKKKRGIIPNGTVKILAERPYVDSDVTGWECEVTCIADEDGVYVYWYLEDDDAPGA